MLAAAAEEEEEEEGEGEGEEKEEEVFRITGKYCSETSKPGF